MKFTIPDNANLGNGSINLTLVNLKDCNTFVHNFQIQEVSSNL